MLVLQVVLLFEIVNSIHIPTCSGDNESCKKLDCCNKNCNHQTKHCTDCHDENIACQVTKDCCDYLYCDGVCSECIKSNSRYPCTDDSQCCSLVCISNYCLSCSGSGGYCRTGHYDCCSHLYCDNNRCVNCGQPYTKCVFNDECCTNSCVNGQCTACAAVGAVCTKNEECCGGRCSRFKGQQYRCLCSHVVGGKCRFASDCCSGLKCDMMYDPNRSLFHLGCTPV